LSNLRRRDGEQRSMPRVKLRHERWRLMSRTA
jgi:hypothetical protein